MLEISNPFSSAVFNTFEISHYSNNSLSWDSFNWSVNVNGSKTWCSFMPSCAVGRLCQQVLQGLLSLSLAFHYYLSTSVLSSNFNNFFPDLLLTLFRASRISSTTCIIRFSPFVLKLLNSPSVTKPIASIPSLASCLVLLVNSRTSWFFSEWYGTYWIGRQ